MDHSHGTQTGLERPGPRGPGPGSSSRLAPRGRRGPGRRGKPGPGPGLNPVVLPGGPGGGDSELGPRSRGPRAGRDSDLTRDRRTVKPLNRAPGYS
eukprot:263692-Hanusia_phi.AAC.1